MEVLHKQIRRAAFNRCGGFASERFFHADVRAVFVQIDLSELSVADRLIKACGTGLGGQLDRFASVGTCSGFQLLQHGCAQSASAMGREHGNAADVHRARSLCGKQPSGSNGGVAVEQDKMQRSPVDLVELVDKALFFDKNAGADIARLG